MVIEGYYHADINNACKDFYINRVYVTGFDRRRLDKA